MTRRKKAVLVGAGGISDSWFGPLAAEKVQVVGVVDLVIERARAQIGKYELDCEASTDLKAALKKTRPHFVVDCTVPEAHCPVTCTALRAGCHVVGEKPMASSMAEARRMVRTAKQTRKMYMVSQSQRWDTNHDVVRKVVTGGKIGKPTTINCDFYVGAHFGGFRVKMASPLILDMSIHHFDLARFMTGLDPLAVYAKEFNPTGSWYKGDAGASCIFEMSRGVVFTYRGSWCSEGYATSWNGDWRIIGHKGTLVYEQDWHPSAKIAMGGINRKGKAPAGIKDVRTPKEMLKYTGIHGALREMLRFLRTGRKPQTECRDNIKSLAMVFAAIESSRKGRRVRIRAM